MERGSERETKRWRWRDHSTAKHSKAQQSTGDIPSQPHPLYHLKPQGFFDFTLFVDIDSSATRTMRVQVLISKSLPPGTKPGTRVKVSAQEASRPRQEYIRAMKLWTGACGTQKGAGATSWGAGVQPSGALKSRGQEEGVSRTNDDSCAPICAPVPPSPSPPLLCASNQHLAHYLPSHPTTTTTTPTTSPPTPRLPRRTARQPHARWDRAAA